MPLPYCASHLEEDNLRELPGSPEDIEPLIPDDIYKGEHASKSLQRTKDFNFWVQKPHTKIWLIHVLAFILYTVAFLVFTTSTILPTLAGQEQRLVYCM